MAINTFFQKTADAKDIAPSMAVGFTINHISAVVIPVIGGALWMINWRIPFIGGAVIAVLSLVFSQMITIQRRKLQETLQ
jgi:MFS family permease